MSLEMRDRCGRCGRDLGWGDPASICSQECMFCEDCAAEMGRISQLARPDGRMVHASYPSDWNGAPER